MSRGTIAGATATHLSGFASFHPAPAQNQPGKKGQHSLSGSGFSETENSGSVVPAFSPLKRGQVLTKSHSRSDPLFLMFLYSEALKELVFG